MKYKMRITANLSISWDRYLLNWSLISASQAKSSWQRNMKYLVAGDYKHYLRCSSHENVLLRSPSVGITIDWALLLPFWIHEHVHVEGRHSVDYFQPISEHSRNASSGPFLPPRLLKQDSSNKWHWLKDSPRNWLIF